MTLEFMENLRSRSAVLTSDGLTHRPGLELEVLSRLNKPMPNRNRFVEAGQHV